MMNYQNKLVIAGSFDTVANIYARGHAEYDGAFFSFTGSGFIGNGLLNANIYTLSGWGFKLVAGGDFTRVDDVPCSGLAYLQNVNWNAPWNIVSKGKGKVLAMAVDSAHHLLYAGGDFYASGSTILNHIAQWDGSAWHPMGDGFDGKVYSLALYNDTLYVGGFFQTSGSDSLSNIARWNGTNWEWAGTGMNDRVLAMAVNNDALYMGGEFTNADGVDVNYVAKWHGSSFQPLGNGTDNNVRALFSFENNLIVGGEFTHAGATPANRIARWNDTTWTNFGLGFNDQVLTVTSVEGELYAGGQFLYSGTDTVNHVAEWNDTSWEEVGDGLPTYGQGSVTLDDIAFSSTDSPNKAVAFFTEDNGEWLSVVPENLFKEATAMNVMDDTLFSGAYIFENDQPTPAYSGILKASLGIPQAAFIVDTIICAGGVAQFNDITSGLEYGRDWHFPGGTPNNSSEANPAISYSSPGTYSATLIVYGIEENDTINKNFTIAFDTPPAISASGIDSVCSGDTVMLKMYGAENYSVANADAVVNASIAFVMPQITTDYMISGYDDQGCAATTSFTVNIFPTGSFIYCLAQTVCTDGAPIDFSTCFAPSNGIATGDGVINNIFYPAIAGDGTHEVTVNFPTTCPHSSTMMIDVQSPPQVSLTVTDSICVNENSLLLNGGAPSGGTYAGNGINFDGTNYYFNPSVAGIGTQAITYNYANACGVYQAFQNILVSDTSEIIFNLIDTTCNTNPPILLSALPVGGSYSGNGVLNGYFDPSLAQSGNNIITYTYTNTSSCISTKQKTIDVEVCTGVDEAIVSEVTITPNPSSGIFNIIFSDIKNLPTILTVDDVTGKKTY